MIWIRRIRVRVHIILVLFLIALSVALLACGPAKSAVPVEPTLSMVRYSDSVLGFTVDYPREWQVNGPTAQAVDPSMQIYYVVEFVSDLYAFGEQAFGRYTVTVAVGESTGGTLTETVAYNLAPIVPPFRDQIKTRCCLEVGGEPAMELVSSLARWGSRQVVVLHEGREYSLTLYPQIGLDGDTVSGVTARAAFETFLDTFAFIPITAVPPPVTPTVTLAPTPMPTESVPLPTIAAAPTLALARASAPSLGEPIVLGRGQIADAAFTRDGTAVAIGWANGISLVAVQGTVERWWRPTGVPVIALDAHPNGQSVAAALSDGSILILDAANGNPARYDGARPHAYWGDVAWSPDGRTIAFQFIGLRRGDPIYLLDVADGSLDEVPGSRIDTGTWPFLAWSPDSRTITLAAPGEQCPRIVGARTGETALVLPVEGACASPWDIAWSPDGRTIAAGGSLIEPLSGDVVSELEAGGEGFGPGRPGWPISFSTDGAFVAAGGQISGPGELSPIVVWNAGTGQVVARFSEASVVSALGNRCRAWRSSWTKIACSRCTRMATSSAGRSAAGSLMVRSWAGYHIMGAGSRSIPGKQRGR